MLTEWEKQTKALRIAIFGTEERPANQSAISRKTGLAQSTLSHWKKTPTAMPAVGLAKVIKAQQLSDSEVLRIFKLLGDI